MTQKELFGKLITNDAYLASYGPLDGFEKTCTYARQSMCAEVVQKYEPKTVLEVGCGAMMLSEMVLPDAAYLSKWIIVEPIREFCDAANNSIGSDPRFVVLNYYLEETDRKLFEIERDGFDVILLSGLLHETTRPLELIQVAKKHLSKNGVIVASVPNAYSFHRLLAVKARVIENVHELSERNRALGHATVFDIGTLTELFSQAGMKILDFFGALFKPFTNKQIEEINLPEGVFEAMVKLGRCFPENAAEIFVIAR